jgi:hypothetical protein
MKNITKIFIVLLVISILFVTYQSLYLEGFKEAPVPSCGNTRNIKDTNAPACYSTVKEDYNGFADVMKSDYILKTQVVTPVCPNSPFTGWDDDYYPEYDDDYDKKHKNDFRPFHYDISLNNSKNSKDSKDSKDSKEPEPNSKPSTQAEYKEGAPIVNQPIDDKLSIPKVNTPAEPSSSEDKKSQPSSLDSCPPCPACKRCPEPVVECKKVVNYKKAGSDNLPVPLIADFSKF